MVTKQISSLIRHLLVGFRHSRGHFPFGGRRPPEPPPPWPVSPSASSRKPPFVTFCTAGLNLVQLCFCGATSRRFSTISPPIISAIDIPPSFGMLCASLSYGVIYLRVYILLRLSALPSWAVRSTQLHPVTVTRLALPSFITIHPLPSFGAVLRGEEALPAKKCTAHTAYFLGYQPSAPFYADSFTKQRCSRGYIAQQPLPISIINCRNHFLLPSSPYIIRHHVLLAPFFPWE